MPKQQSRRAAAHPQAWRAGRLALALLAPAWLAGCAVGVGVGIPLLPGLSLNVGVGSGGPSLGLGTGWGPLGAGVSVNPSGQFVGSAGVGVGAGPVGVGVGQSVMLHDPQAAPAYAQRLAPAPGIGSAGDPVAP